jgi:hypothetical protein
VILFNVFSSLSSQATKIAIQRDWVVVISDSIKGKNEPEPMETAQVTKGPKKNFKLASKSIGSTISFSYYHLI